jgi:TRAP transporter 4TM/12TM fusion protein
MRHLTRSLSCLLPLLVSAWVLDLPGSLGLLVQTEQVLAAALAIALPLVFLIVPAGSGRSRSEAERIPLFDIAAAAAGAASCLYIAVRFPELAGTLNAPTGAGLGVACIAVALLLEGLRRTAGWGITAVTVGCVLLALNGHRLPGSLQGREIDPAHLVYFLVWDASAILGTATNVVATLVVAFVLFGNTLLCAGGAQVFTDLSLALMGRFRGGSAKMAILASMLFGSVSGSVVANVVTTGSVSIPMMKKGGFTSEQSAATEAVASTGGQIMPPVMGVTAFLMAEFLGLPYAQIAVAAIVPALLFYAALFLHVDLIAARDGIEPPHADRATGGGRALRAGWRCLMPLAVLVLALFQLRMAPERAALLAAAIGFATTLIRPGSGASRSVFRDAVGILSDSGRAALDLFMIAAAAGIVLASLNYTGLGFAISVALVEVAQDSTLLLLILTGLAAIVLGMGMPTPAVYILLAPLLAPTLIAQGISALAAHMFIFYYGMLSMITPPVAIGAFAAASISGASGMRTAWISVQMAWSVFLVPFAFVFSDTLLLTGEAGAVLMDVATALAGLVLVTAGLAGFAMTRLTPRSRLTATLAGLALLVPPSVGPQALCVNLAALLVAAAWCFGELRRHRRGFSAGLHGHGNRGAACDTALPQHNSLDP